MLEPRTWAKALEYAHMVSRYKGCEVTVMTRSGDKGYGRVSYRLALPEEVEELERDHYRAMVSVRAIRISNADSGTVARKLRDRSEN